VPAGEAAYIEQQTNCHGANERHAVREQASAKRERASVRRERSERLARAQRAFGASAASVSSERSERIVLSLAEQHR
jgi:hypothetical protein